MRLNGTGLVLICTMRTNRIRSCVTKSKIHQVIAGNSTAAKAVDIGASASQEREACVLHVESSRTVASLVSIESSAFWLSLRKNGDKD